MLSGVANWCTAMDVASITQKYYRNGALRRMYASRIFHDGHKGTMPALGFGPGQASCVLRLCV